MWAGNFSRTTPPPTASIAACEGWLASHPPATLPPASEASLSRIPHNGSWYSLDSAAGGSGAGLDVDGHWTRTSMESNASSGASAASTLPQTAGAASSSAGRTAYLAWAANTGTKVLEDSCVLAAPIGAAAVTSVPAAVYAKTSARLPPAAVAASGPAPASTFLPVTSVWATTGRTAPGPLPVSETQLQETLAAAHLLPTAAASVRPPTSAPNSRPLTPPVADLRATPAHSTAACTIPAVPVSLQGTVAAVAAPPASRPASLRVAGKLSVAHTVSVSLPAVAAVSPALSAANASLTSANARLRQELDQQRLRLRSAERQHQAHLAEVLQEAALHEMAAVEDSLGLERLR